MPTMLPNKVIASLVPILFQRAKKVWTVKAKRCKVISHDIKVSQPVEYKNNPTCP